MKRTIKIQCIITALCLICFAATARAIPLEIGPDRITSLLEVNVNHFQPGNRPASSMSLDLEFDRPIYISTGEIVLACSVIWPATTWANVLSQISSQANYVLDSKGDWLPFGRPEIGVSPFGAMWLKIYVDEPLALYGVRYDWHIPNLYFGTPELWVRSNVRPFQVGGTVPESGSTVALLALGLLFCFGLRRLE